MSHMQQFLLKDIRIMNEFISVHEILIQYCNGRMKFKNDKAQKGYSSDL